MMLPDFEGFLESLERLSYSPDTIYNYERDLNVFDRFLQDSGVSFLDMGRNTIVLYKSYLTSQARKTADDVRPGSMPLSARSVKRMLSALRFYLKYLVDMDHPCPVAPEAVKMTKLERKHPQVSQLDDLVRLIEAPRHLESNPRVALRNQAMLEVLFATGMRISELLSINRSQIDDSGRVFITGKGKKQRFVYLTLRARECVERYLETREDSSPALFVPYAGRNVGNRKRRISPNCLQGKI